ncbi:MAG: SusC/RagA family TonB-linked outer membrane protein, partial [Bacteroidaceae bacterium]|nr:SusC/RagA family TonB-linked outer membrane protein [Bacteroidaceae bacterium]
WELYFKGENVIKKGKFSATFDFNLGNNRNVITSMDPTVLASMNGEFNRQNGSYLSRVQLDNPFGAIYGFRYKGVYQYSKYSEVEVPGISGPNAPVARDAEGNVITDKYGLTVPMVFCYDNKNQSYIYEFKGGDAIYEDINHDGQINELDIVYLGSSLPKMNGGFSIRLNYGRFSWNSHLNFRFGNKIVNGARMNAESMYGNNNQSTAVNWRWRVEGDIAPIPRALYQSGYNYLGSDRFVEPGAFLRLGYTQFRYSFDPKKLKSYGINNLSLSLNMNNLFCLTKYSGCEPEVSPGRGNVAMDNAKTPRSRTYTLRLDVQF